MTDVPEDLLREMLEDRDERVANADTRSLEELGVAALSLELEIADLEAVLKAKNKALSILMEHLIPEALSVAGISEFGFDNPEGGRARIENGIQVYASLSRAPDVDAAIKILEESGFAGGVLTTLSLSFTQGETDLIDAAQSAMTEASDRDPSITRGVNPSSLAAFVRAKLKEDPTFDYTAVGATAVPKSKFTKRK